MPGLLVIKIVTPDGVLVDTDADMIEFPTTAGELGVLPGHVPLIVELGAGEIRLHRSNGMEIFALAGGFARVCPDDVEMLASFATSGDDEAEIDRAFERAQRALEESGMLTADEIKAEVALVQVELARLRQRKRRKS